MAGPADLDHNVPSPGRGKGTVGSGKTLHCVVKGRILPSIVETV